MKKLSAFLFFISIISFANAQITPRSGSLNGRWIFVSSSETDLGKIPDNQVPDLVITDSAKSFWGSAGCNKISGSYETTAEEFNFGPMISTFKACPDMHVEKYITHFLPLVGSYRIEENRLYLYDKDDKEKFLVYKRNVM